MAGESWYGSDEGQSDGRGRRLAANLRIIMIILQVLIFSLLQGQGTSIGYDSATTETSGLDVIASTTLPDRALRIPAPGRVLPRHDMASILAALRYCSFNTAAEFLQRDAGAAAMLPPSFTIFAPFDEAVDWISRRPSQATNELMAYHIMPQQLSFHALLFLPVGTRLQTLLPGRTLLVTDSCSRMLSRSRATDCNFTLDGVTVTTPEFYRDRTMTIYGVTSLLDPAEFGEPLAR
jgi:hypothetical protein